MAEFDYREKMVSDLLEQFRGKKNIGVIVESYAAQLQEVYEFLLSLLNLLDLDACTGAQLDLIGGIVVLTRYDARVIAGRSYEGKVLDDDQYRNLLKWKILLNTNDCTYWSIVKGIKFFWKKPIRYFLDAAYPATMILDVGTLDGSGDIEDLINAPIIRAGGVDVHFRTSINPIKMTIYTGFAVRLGHVIMVSCAIPPALDVTYLVDETGNLLADEAGNRIIDEEMS